MRVLWYPVPEDTPCLPFEHIFPLRAWDQREDYEEPELGTKYDPPEKYTGPLPIHQVGDVGGTADQWLYGLSFASYLNDEYQATCGALAMPVYVATLASANGSIIVSAPSGNVDIAVNPAVENHWSITQYFTPPDVNAAAIVIEHLADQVGAVFVIRDPADVPMVSFLPRGTSGESWRLHLRRNDNTVGVTLSNLILQMNEHSSENSITISNYTSYATWTSKHFMVHATSGRIVLKGAGIVGQAVTTALAEEVTAIWTVYALDSGSPAAMKVVGDLGEGAVDVHWWGKTGDATHLGRMAIGDANVDASSHLYIRKLGNFHGVNVHTTASAIPGWFAYRFEAAGGSLMVGLRHDGYWSYPTLDSANTVGNVIKRIPVYDKDGEFVGYIPVYDSITNVS